MLRRVDIAVSRSRLPKPARSGGNYRIYDNAHAQRLSFIRHCRALDMNLEEIHVLLRFKDAQPIVLALPRGGVPVGFEIARTLGAPLDVVPTPWQQKALRPGQTQG